MHACIETCIETEKMNKVDYIFLETDSDYGR
jgi:hypothetical protein